MPARARAPPPTPTLVRRGWQCLLPCPPNFGGVLRFHASPGRPPLRACVRARGGGGGWRGSAAAYPHPSSAAQRAGHPRAREGRRSLRHRWSAAPCALAEARARARARARTHLVPDLVEDDDPLVHLLEGALDLLQQPPCGHRGRAPAPARAARGARGRGAARRGAEGGRLGGEAAAPARAGRPHTAHGSRLGKGADARGAGRRRQAGRRARAKAHCSPAARAQKRADGMESNAGGFFWVCF